MHAAPVAALPEIRSRLLATKKVVLTSSAPQPLVRCGTTTQAERSSQPNQDKSAETASAH